MKNFLTNRSIRQARALITGLLFAVLFASLFHLESQLYASMVFVVSFFGGIAVAKGFTRSERRYMAMSCTGLITDDIEEDCDNPLIGGTNATFYIANFDDVLSIDISSTNDMVADAITMVSTKVFFTVEGKLQSFKPKYTFSKSTYVNQYLHEAEFFVFNISPAAKDQVYKMKDGNFILIVRNNATGNDGDSKYEIYGAGAGLKCEDSGRDPSDADNLGAIRVLLKTQDYAKEGKPPLTFYDTDSTTTELAIAALLVP